MLEIMPVADFVGKFGWGYDGVDLFAPTRLYGTPDEFRGFVDRAHALGLGVILDVVYNHLGPAGNYLRPFSDAYFSTRYLCDWDEAMNFDDENSGPVREFFLTNAACWIEEFHLDGLRLDATQQLFDASPLHIVAEIGIRARAAAGTRSIYVVTENEPQESRMLRPVESGRYGLDALWNDDFHHSAMVALTGRNEAYYIDYLGTAQEFVSAAKWGRLFQGQFSRWQKKRRGSPMFGLPPTAFVNFLQNHDQIANSALGARVHQLTSAAKFRALTALLLLLPGTPMLFQGQELAATTCFHYFADHEPALAALVAEGRREFLSQFPSIEQPETMDLLRDPADEQTFLRSKLDFAERERHALVYALHRDLLKIRREDPFFREPQPGTFDGAVLSEEAFILRYFGAGHQHRLLVVNLGRDLHLPSAPEPRLAPPPGCEWETLFTSEDPTYGGVGNPPLETPDEWRVPGSAAVYLAPRPALSGS